MTGRISGNDHALTGLESAVVLIAFVVVASVFAYVVIGSGLFTAQKSKEVVYDAVDHVTSSMEIAGYSGGYIQSEVSSQENNLVTVSVTVKLPKYSSAIDLSRTTAKLITNMSVNNSIFFPEQGKTVIWLQTAESNPDMILETGEVAELFFTDLDLPRGMSGTVQIIPPQGQPMSISVKAPE